MDKKDTSPDSLLSVPCIKKIKFAAAGEKAMHSFLSHLVIRYPKVDMILGDEALLVRLCENFQLAIMADIDLQQKIVFLAKERNHILTVEEVCINQTIFMAGEDESVNEVASAEVASAEIPSAEGASAKSNVEFAKIDAGTDSKLLDGGLSDYYQKISERYSDDVERWMFGEWRNCKDIWVLIHPDHSKLFTQLQKNILSKLAGSTMDYVASCLKNSLLRARNAVMKSIEQTKDYVDNFIKQYSDDLSPQVINTLLTQHLAIIQHTQKINMAFAKILAKAVDGHVAQPSELSV